MVDQKLVDYVRNALQQGESVESLKQVLINQGWSAADVDAAIASVQGSSARPEQAPAQAAPQTGIGVAGKFKSALISPGQLFEAVKQEHDLNNAVKYYALLLVIPVAVSLIITLINPTILSNMNSVFSMFAGPLAGLFTVFIFIGGVALVGLYFIGILGSFFYAGLFHVFAMMLRAEKNGYAQTYKSVSYAAPVGIIGSMVFIILNLVIPGQILIAGIIGVFFMAWSLVVTIIGLSHLHGISKRRAAAVVVTPFVIITVVVLLVQYVILPMVVQNFMAGMMSGGLHGNFFNFSV